MLWQGVDNFGQAVYQVELQRAKNWGLYAQDPARARLWAADRANAWAGHVRPENWKGNMRNLSHIGMFAPNWWRSFGALLTGHYDRTGIAGGQGLGSMIAVNEMRTIMAMYTFQKVADNVMNLVLSGHPQWENQPGNQDRLELDNMVTAWDSITGQHQPVVDPKTGGHLTLEPFLTRQPYALEKAVGLEGRESTQIPGGIPTRGYHLEDVPGAMAAEAAGRLSPLLNAIATMANVDLYQSAAKGELYRVNPKDGAFHPGGPQLLAALSQLTPTTLTGAMERATSQGASVQEPLLPGWVNTTVPKNLKDAIGQSADRLLFGLLGINPPYTYASKTRGRGTTQDELQRVKEQTDQFNGHIGTLSREMFEGTKDPAATLKEYRDVSTAYHGFLNAMFAGAPYYKNGQLGLYHDWEDLYRQATGEDGQIDWAKLDQLQVGFEGKHTQAEMQALHSMGSKAEVQAPFLRVYHETLDQYKKFQQTYAAQAGLSVTELRRRASVYSALYSNAIASRNYLYEHPEIRDYERAKREWEVSTSAGLMYGMFFNTGTVARWLVRRGIDWHHLIQQITQQEQIQTPQGEQTMEGLSQSAPAA
jgi:hypothetical protein